MQPIPQTRYLAGEDDRSINSGLAALDRLKQSEDFSIVVAALIEPSIRACSRQCVELSHSCPDLPGYQGAARALTELLDTFRGARDRLERRRNAAQTHSPGRKIAGADV